MRRPGLSMILSAAMLAALAMFSGAALADEAECGSLTNAFGPFDYRDHSKAKELHLVNIGHVTDDVISLRKGSSSYRPINDLDYALRAFPNHWVALDAVSRLDLQGGDLRGFRTVDCYFDRAIRFAPDDANVRLLYGIYLFRKKRDEEARTQLETAARLAPDSIDVAYNLGLLYLKMDQLDLAMKEARMAYGKGYPLPGLREGLEKAGAWKDP